MKAEKVFSNKRDWTDTAPGKSVVNTTESLAEINELRPISQRYMKKTIYLKWI